MIDFAGALDKSRNNKFPLQACFEESGNYNLFSEFIDVLINECEIPLKLRRQIWALGSTSDAQDFARCCAIVAAFQDSEGPEDLAVLWRRVVDTYWNSYRDCPLKKELEAL